MAYIVTERPSFKDDELLDELRKVCLIDDILANNGALDIGHLYALVQKAEESSVFENIETMAEFLKIRSNVFDLNFGVVKNRSSAFREMFGYLVNFVCNNAPAERSINDIRDVLQKFKEVQKYEIDHTDEGLVEFVERHPNFFQLKNNFKLILNPACLKIPSAWERCSLPVYVRPKIRYDRSIVFAGIGKVVSAVASTQYIKILITKGKWTGQTVYGISKNISQNENIALKYPLNTMVEVCAFRAYYAAQPWTAYELRALSKNADGDGWSVGKKEARVENQNLAAISTDVVEKQPYFVSKEDFFKSVLESELQRIVEIDFVLGNSELPYRTLFEKTMDRCNFAFYSHLTYFLESRPHLYETANHLVKRRPEYYRSEIFKVLCFIDLMSKERVKIHTLRKQIMDNESFMDETRAIAKKAKDFRDFITTHSSLFEIGEHLGEEYIWLRGTLVRQKKIFIPFFFFDSDVVLKSF